jgi:hypothetical protein
MEPNAILQKTPSELADDILEGADAIAEFLFGSREHRRKVDYLAECSKLPIFRLGSVLCARKSVPFGVYIGPGKPRAFTRRVNELTGSHEPGLGPRQ